MPQKLWQSYVSHGLHGDYTKDQSSLKMFIDDANLFIIKPS